MRSYGSANIIQRNYKFCSISMENFKVLLIGLAMIHKSKTGKQTAPAYEEWI